MYKLFLAIIIASSTQNFTPAEEKQTTNFAKQIITQAGVIVIVKQRLILPDITNSYFYDTDDVVYILHSQRRFTRWSGYINRLKKRNKIKKDLQVHIYLSPDTDLITGNTFGSGQAYLCSYLNRRGISVTTINKNITLDANTTAHEWLHTLCVPHSYRKRNLMNPSPPADLVDGEMLPIFKSSIKYIV